MKVVKLTLVNPSTDKIHLGKTIFARVKAELDRSNLDQKDLAAGAGLSGGMITKYKSGAVPGCAELLRIANFLKIEPGWLLTGAAESPRPALRESSPDYLVDDLLSEIDSLKEQLGAVERAAHRLKKGKP